MDFELVNERSRVDFNNRIMSNFYHTNIDELKERADRYEIRRMNYRETIMKLTVNTRTKKNRIT